MTVKERVNQFVAYKGIKISSFEASIGVSKSYWNNTLKISAEVVAEILRVYSELSAEWLMRGEGEMIKAIGGTSEEPRQEKCEFAVYVDENGFLKLKR